MRLILIVNILVLFCAGILHAEWTYNPQTRKSDYYEGTQTVHEYYYFDSDKNTYLYFDGSNVMLYVNGTKEQQWPEARVTQNIVYNSQNVTYSGQQVTY